MQMRYSRTKINSNWQYSMHILDLNANMFAVGDAVELFWGILKCRFGFIGIIIRDFQSRVNSFLQFFEAGSYPQK